MKAFTTFISRYTLLPYVAALAAIAATLALRGVLTPLLGSSAPYLPLLPAVVFAALYCGLGPSIICVIAGLVGAKYSFIPPLHSAHIAGRADLATMILFVIVCAIIIAAGGMHRRDRQIMLKEQGELEQKVLQRTADLNHANQSLRHLTARLLEIQDEERRRFARELHDSAGQTLTALSMNLSAVQSEIERLTRTAAAVQDSTALVQDLSKEIRTISHLLHPPLLDESGLTSALGWYIDGFAERSGINVDLQIPDDFARLPRESEITIFRVVQECLTNIHRHSGSPSARIRISRTAHDLRVEVEDRGRGIPPEQQLKMASAGSPGVGIRGMRERVRQLGGSLDIRSSGKGTQVLVVLPVAGTSSIAAA